MKPHMKRAAAQKGVPPIVVTAEQRYHLINDVACFRWLNKSAEGVNDPARCWCEAEREIDRLLKTKHVVQSD